MKFIYFKISLLSNLKNRFRLRGRNENMILVSLALIIGVFKIKQWEELIK